jgi:hypothetical protein
MSTAAARPRRRPHTRRRWAAGLLGGVLVAAPVVALPTAADAAPRVTWSDLSVVAGKKVTATVKPGSVAKRADVVLQRKFPDRWRIADGTAKRTDGGLELRVPTRQYGSFDYRVAAVDGTTVLETFEAVRVRVAPPYSPAGPASAHAFMASPRWQWDSCRTITWKFNRAGSPKGGLKQVRGAIARVHAATGLEFVYAGRTRQTPRFQGVKGTDVIVGWLGRKAFTRKYGSMVGIAGATYATGWKLPDGTSVSRAVRGGVVLNARWKPNLRNGFGRGYTWGEVVMHELGHVVGLDHVRNDTQLMFDTVTGGAARWGAGDLNGFRKLGDAGGCLSARNARALESPHMVARSS